MNQERKHKCKRCKEDCTGAVMFGIIWLVVAIVFFIQWVTA